MGDELWGKSVGELAALNRTREVSSVEVVQAHLTAPVGSTPLDPAAKNR